MSTDLRAIMSRDRRHRAMLHDPDLTGDTLLFALALHEVIMTCKEQGQQVDGRWARDVADIALGDQPEAWRAAWVKRTIELDIPRYEPAKDESSHRCVAPMIRRDGLCGKRCQGTFLDRDPDTGEGRWIVLCPRHKELRPKFDARRKAWIANGSPTPPPNKGGALMRHFSANWDAFYRWADPHQKPALDGTRKDTREPVPPRPALRLIHGGEDQD